MAKEVRLLVNDEALHYLSDLSGEEREILVSRAIVAYATKNKLGRKLCGVLPPVSKRKKKVQNSDSVSLRGEASGDVPADSFNGA